MSRLLLFWQFFFYCAGIGWAQNLEHAPVLEAAGIRPVHTVNVAGAQLQLSNPIALDSSHQIAVAWIEIADEKAIRVLYRSNSQCSWRVCDATTPNHIGKGFHEFDKQVPIDVTIKLLRATDVIEIKKWYEADESPSQEVLANKLLRLLTVDRDEGIRSGEIDAQAGTYVTREYSSTIPSMPVRFSIVRGSINNAAGGQMADPKQTELPDKPRLPNFEIEVESVSFNIPSYAQYVGGTGQLIGRVYLSHDKSIKYLFIEDEQQRVMLSGAELVSAPVSLLGVRTRYLDTRGMDAPLMEYGAQIPEQYGGRKKSRYQSAWPLVREQPIIALYYRELKRSIP